MALKLTRFRRAIHLNKLDVTGVVCIALVNQHDVVLADGEAIGDIERSYSARVERLVGAAEDGVVIHQTYQAGWRWSHPGGGDGHVESSMLIAMHWIRRHCESDLRRIETRWIDQLHQTVRTALVIAVCYVGCGDEVETVAQQAGWQCSSPRNHVCRSQRSICRINEVY